MRYLRQNTAVRITVGPFHDFEDGVTPETALTVTNSTLTIITDVDDGDAPTVVKNGTLTASGGDNDMVHLANGYYDLELTAAQTNYVGRCSLSIHDPDVHCPVFHEFFIIPQQLYDSLIGEDYIQVDTIQVSGQSQTANDNGADINSIKTVTDALPNSGALTDIDTGVNNIEAKLPTNYIMGSSVLTAKDDEIDAIKAKTDNLPASPAAVGSAMTLSDGAITAAKIASSAITDTKIATSAITAAKIATSAITDTKIASNAITAAKFATDAISASKVAADAVTKIQSGLATSANLQTVDDTVDSIKTDTGTTIQSAIASLNGDVDTVNNRLTASRAGYLDNLDISENVAGTSEVSAVSTKLGTNGDGLSAIPWNASWDTEVQSEVNDALVALHLDHLLAVDYDPASKPGVVTALLNELVENDAGVSRFTINALENAPSGSGASAESIADAVLDELLSGHTDAGSLGKAIADILVDSGTTIQDLITNLNNISAADVNAQCDTALADYNGPTRAEATSDKNEIITQVNANETKIDTMLANQTDIETKVDSIISAVGALADISAADVVTALQASTGWTEGGTWTMAKLYKYLIAAVMGVGVDQGTADTYNIKDPDGGDVVFRFVRSDTSPYKVVTEVV